MKGPSTYFLHVVIDQYPFHGSYEYPREKASRGLMDKASVFGTEDCRFDPCRDQKYFFLLLRLAFDASWCKRHPREVSWRSVKCGGVGALAKRRREKLWKNQTYTI